MKKIMVIGLLFLTSSIVWAQFPAPKIVQKQLGDINGDGIKEVAIETTNFGVSSCYTVVKIQAKGKTIFTLPDLLGDTADGYKIVGKQIVVWCGDWISVDSKWKPHYYDFYWYGWDLKKHCFVQRKEGFTRQSYGYKRAKSLMPKLSQKYSKEIVASKSESFERDAIVLANKKYHQRFTQAKRSTIPGFPRQGRSYGIVSPQWIYVNFNRDGSVEIDTM